jgi:predicted metal-dependent hydrolase
MTHSAQRQLNYLLEWHRIEDLEHVAILGYD